MKDASYQARQERLERERQAGENFQKVLRECAHQVIRVLHEGATEMAWSTRYDDDDGLRWDAKREVWVGSDGFSFDGERLFAY